MLPMFIRGWNMLNLQFFRASPLKWGTWAVCNGTPNRSLADFLGSLMKAGYGCLSCIPLATGDSVGSNFYLGNHSKWYGARITGNVPDMWLWSDASWIGAVVLPGQFPWPAHVFWFEKPCEIETICFLHKNKWRPRTMIVCVCGWTVNFRPLSDGPALRSVAFSSERLSLPELNKSPCGCTEIKRKRQYAAFNTTVRLCDLVRSLYQINHRRPLRCQLWYLHSLKMS